MAGFWDAPASLPEIIIYIENYYLHRNYCVTHGWVLVLARSRRLILFFRLATPRQGALVYTRFQGKNTIWLKSTTVWEAPAKDLKSFCTSKTASTGDATRQFASRLPELIIYTENYYLHRKLLFTQKITITHGSRLPSVQKG